MAVLTELVDDKAHNMRLDTFLASLEGAPSRSACTKIIEEGHVTINGTPAFSKSERVQMGDYVQAEIPDPQRANPMLSPNPIPLDIRFEDDRLIVLSKQAGLVCHPSPGHIDDTLANALVAHCGPEHVGLLQGEDRPGIVHRLDRDTSGLMVAAKDDEIQKELQDLIRMRTLDRRYVALVQGYIAPDNGIIDANIARSTRDRTRQMATDDPAARGAITTFATLERFEAGPKDDGYTLVECHLYTGRTHQIRVHMAHIHHPVVGDPLYGLGDLKKNLGLTRQFLHSWHIEFEHPATHQLISLADTLPEDLSQALEPLEDRSMGRTEAGEQIVPQLFDQTPHRTS